MTLSRTNTILAVLLACTMALAWTSDVDYSRPNIEILPDMKYSPAYSAYSSNPNLPNGRTFQPPVSGTIARGNLPLHYQATPADAIRAGEQLPNPLLELEDPQRQAATRRGGETFRILCTACHGGSGKGDGLVPKYGFPPPPSLLTGKSVQMKDGQLFHIVTYGQGSMPNFAAQLTPARRWEVIQFIRSLQDQAKAQPAAAAPPTAAAGPKSEKEPNSEGPKESEAQTPRILEDNPKQASKPEAASEETTPEPKATPPATPTTKPAQESEVETTPSGNSPAIGEAE